MIRRGFLDSELRNDLTELARDGSAAHRLARRANALVLLDDGMSCEAVAKVLLLDDDTVRTWHRLYEEDGIEGLTNFGYEGSACHLNEEQRHAGSKDEAAQDIAALEIRAEQPVHAAAGGPDNGSSHRGPRAADRLRTKWPNVVLVHTPIHASWLNQIEVYFSIVQRKLLTPSDFVDLGALSRGLMAFQNRYQRAAKPFRWTFTRRDLHVLIAKLRSHNAS